MTDQHVDAIVIGSGAGGAAVAYALTQAGRRVLVLEKGQPLPLDGSTLDVDTVMRQGRFSNTQSWRDHQGKTFVPGEFYNLGGKTKWYGAALLRFSPHEFEADAAHQCLPWPIAYAELAPFYDQAEQLLGVRHFEHEPELQALLARLCVPNSGWRYTSLPMGLQAAILQDPPEAKHFDGFASVAGYKADAEHQFLAAVKSAHGCDVRTGQEVIGFTHADGDPTLITGVTCAGDNVYHAPNIILAAGAMTSPRLLQAYMRQTQLDQRLANTNLIGANFKMHINSALLAFSLARRHDILRKTAILYHDRYAHSSVQPLGWLDGEILATQLPASMPRFLSRQLGARAYGFFITTEDGSHPANRILASSDTGSDPMMDYDLARIAPSHREHRAIIHTFRASLLRAGMISVARYMGPGGTAHAQGSLVTGDDPATSVVDKNGKVHGMQGLYVADGSVLPRSGRVNPALSIYAWGLRLGEHLGNKHHD